MEMLERALCALAELYSSTMLRTVILFKAKTTALLAHATSHRDLSSLAASGCELLLDGREFL